MKAVSDSALYDKNQKSLECSDEELVAVKKEALSSGEEFRTYVAAGLEDYVEQLKGLIREGQSRDIKFLYVRQAHLPNVAEYPHSKYLPVIWEISEEVLRPYKVPIYDMQAHFRKVENPEKLFKRYPNDNIHLTTRGNSVVADAVINALENFRLFPPN